MTKLSPRATIVASVGHSRVRPAEYLSPIAQVISNNPASSRACHPFTCHPFMDRIAAVESHLARLLLASVAPCNLREMGATVALAIAQEQNRFIVPRAWLAVVLR